MLFALWGQRGWPHRDVVGERFYHDALEEICKNLGSPGSRDSDEVTTTATLVPEPNNPHHAAAVSVRVQGQTVGYLRREDADLFSPVLRALNEQGMIAGVGARIWFGRRDEYLGDDRRGLPRYEVRFYASITLDLDEPHLIVPANPPPREAHELLPLGHSIQVHGEQEHLDALTPFVGPTGEQWVHVTLHELVEVLPRSTRTVVEARIDNKRIGQLSPKLSADLLPAVRYLADRSLLPVARGKAKGNRAAVEVTLHVQRAHQLGDEWFERVGT